MASMTGKEPEPLAKIPRARGDDFAPDIVARRLHLAEESAGQSLPYLAGRPVEARDATGQLDFAVTDDGDLYASIWLPSLLLGTVGGGTGCGTAAECLQIMGVRGDGQANAFAEIVAAAVLAGDISLMAAFCTHEFVAAHEQLGRNRPSDQTNRHTDGRDHE